MTALAPTNMWGSTTSATVTSASTLSALGYAAGDLLIVSQAGIASGASAPAAPTINGSTTGFTDGPDTSGSDIYANSGTNEGRVQQWSKILSSGDLSFTVTVDKAGYSGTLHRFALSKLSHADGFDTARVVQRVISIDSTLTPRTATCSWSGGIASLVCTGSIATIYFVGDVITVTGASRSGYNGTFVVTGITTTTNTNDTVQYAISDPGGTATGATISGNIKLNDINRPACVWILYGLVTSASAGTNTWDGALSGIKYNRDNYYNNGSATDTDGAHGNHYSLGSTIQAQIDYQEYDISDTLLSVLPNSNISNNSHALGVVVYQTAGAPGYLNGKMPSAGSMEGNMAGGTTALTGKMSAAAKMKGSLRPNDGNLDGKTPAASMMGAPAGMDELVGPGTDPLSTTNVKMASAAKMKGDLLTFPTNYFSGKMRIAAKMRGNLNFGLIAPITGSPFYLKWDEFGERFYENGLDRGVIYLQDQSVAVWNGLTEITEKFGSETSPVYYDGRKIGEDIIVGDFSAILKAVTYPDEFALVDGSSPLRHGILVGNQPLQTFDLSWRTLINNDQGQAIGYKIHILYNVTAIPNDKVDATLSDLPNLTEFEWDLSAIPQEIPGFSPSAHFVINSLEVDPWLLENLESLLYGNAGSPPNLPILTDLADFIATWLRIEVIDNGDGTWTATSSHDGVIVVNPDGTFSIFGINGVVIDANTYTISNT